jgi:hypothetical protein
LAQIQFETEPLVILAEEAEPALTE